MSVSVRMWECAKISILFTKCCLLLEANRSRMSERERNNGTEWRSQIEETNSYQQNEWRTSTCSVFSDNMSQLHIQVAFPNHRHFKFVLSIPFYLLSNEMTTQYTHLCEMKRWRSLHLSLFIYSILDSFWFDCVLVEYGIAHSNCRRTHTRIHTK